MPIALRQSNDILEYSSICAYIVPTTITHDDSMGLNKVFKEVYAEYGLSNKLSWLMQHQLPYPVTGSIYSFRFKNLPDIHYVITKYENSDYYTKESLEVVLNSLKNHFENNPSRSIIVMPLLSGNIKTMKRSEVLDLHYQYLDHLSNLIFISQYPNKNNPLTYINISVEKEYTNVNKIDETIDEILKKYNLKLTNIVIPIKEGFNGLFKKKSKYKDNIIDFLVNKRYGQNTMPRYVNMITDLCDIFILDNKNNLNVEKRMILENIKDNKVKIVQIMEGLKIATT